MITATTQIATGRIIGLLTQTGTDTPQLTNIINTIGPLLIARLAAGQYTIYTDTQHTRANTRINGQNDGVNPTLLSLAALNDYYVQCASLDNLITIDLKNAAGVRVELSSLQGGALAIPIDIEIYNNPQTI